DHIPGIPGVGPKTATALLSQFGTLDGVLANVAQISGAKRQESVRQGAEAARLARRLIILRSDLPLEVDWEAARAGRLDTAALAQLFREFGFRRLADQFSSQAQELVPANWQATY